MKNITSYSLSFLLVFSTPVSVFADGGSAGPKMPPCVKKDAKLRKMFEEEHAVVLEFIEERIAEKGPDAIKDAKLCRDLLAHLDNARTAADDCADCRTPPRPQTVEVEQHRRVVEVVRPAPRREPIREQSEGGGGLGEMFSNPLLTGILGFGGGLLLGNLLFKDKGRSQPAYIPPQIAGPAFLPPLRPPGLLGPFPGAGGTGPGAYPGYIPPGGMGYGNYQPGVGYGYYPGQGIPTGVAPGVGYYNPTQGYGYYQPPQYGLLQNQQLAPVVLPPFPGTMRTFSNTNR